MSLKPEIRAILIFAGVALVMCAMIPLGWVYVMSAIWTSGDIPHPTDAEMLRNFQAHKAEFLQMVEMIQKDKGLFRVDVDWVSPDDLSKIGVSTARIEEYRKIFRKVGVPRGFYNYEETGTIDFIASSQGLAVSGSSKSYVYCKTPPTNIVNDIDAYRSDPKINQGYPVYRHIEGYWYLSFETD